MWGGVMLLNWELFFGTVADKSFWKIGVIMKRTFKLFSAVVLKRSD